MFNNIIDNNAAELLMQQFASIFSSPTDVWAGVAAHMDKVRCLSLGVFPSDKLFRAATVVAQAPISCSASSAFPDDLSFRIAKKFSH